MATLTGETNIIVRVYKRAIGNPDYTWANTYEVSLPTPLGENDFADFADLFVAFEQDLHLTSVEFVRVTLSTWVEDDDPYNPASFYVHEVSGEVGERTLVDTQALPRHLALLVKRQVAFGRSGRLFYRGVLTENDMETGTSFDPRLTSTAIGNFNTAMAASYAALISGMESLVGAGSALALIRLTSSETVEVRDVSNLVVRGIVANSPDHRYYDIA